MTITELRIRKLEHDLATLREVIAAGRDYDGALTARADQIARELATLQYQQQGAVS